MNAYQIEQINEKIAEQKKKTPDFIPIDCGFIGSYVEWNNFLIENKQKIQWRARTTAKFSSGEYWRWIPLSKETIFWCRGLALSKLIIPRRIDYKLFLDEIYPGLGRYCIEIEWYGHYEF